MGRKNTYNTLVLWGEAEVTQVDGCDLINPGPQALYGWDGLPNQGTKWPAGILWQPAGGNKYPGL